MSVKKKLMGGGGKNGRERNMSIGKMEEILKRKRGEKKEDGIGDEEQVFKASKKTIRSPERGLEKRINWEWFWKYGKKKWKK